MKSVTALALCLILIPVLSSAATDWEQDWTHQVEQGTTVLDAVQDLRSMILVTTDGMEAVSLENGQTLWSYSFPEGDALIGLPVIAEGMAVYVTYMGKTYKDRAESGDALISALDLGSGMVIWSSYLPEYLPFGKAISNGKLYLACQSARKLLTPKKALRLFERAKGERPDAWLLCVDLGTGDLVWHLHTKVWAEFLAQAKDGEYILEQIGDEENPLTRLSKRRADNGDAIWIANDKDPANVHAVMSNPRGMLFLSDGYSGTYSHLRHPDSGEQMARLALPFSGATALHMDTLWVYGLRESMTFAATRELTAVDWSGLVPLRTQQLKIPGAAVDDAWFMSDKASARFESDPAFWTAHRRRYAIPQHSFTLERGGERILIPNETPAMPASGAVFTDTGFALSERTPGGAFWAYYALGSGDQPVWNVEAKGNQPPVWMAYQGGGRLVSGIDGSVLSFSIIDGSVDTLLVGAPGMALALLGDEGEYIRIGTQGIAKYSPVEEIVAPEPEPEPEPEPVVEATPEPQVETPALEPPPMPKLVAQPKPKPEPEPVVEPQPATVQGWRIQIMYLSRTSRQQAEQLAKLASDRLGLQVDVVPENGALHLLAGQFTNEKEARARLRRVRRTRYSDAFLVRASIPVSH